MKLPGLSETLRRRDADMIFKKSDIPGEDIKRFMGMPAERRKRIDETPADPIPETYAVNELAKALHPGYIKAEVKKKIEVAPDRFTISFRSCSENGRFPFFRAGQYVTVSSNVGGSFATRPYSITSSPFEALGGLLEITVHKSGFFSDFLADSLKEGDIVFVGEPSGDFYHDDLRDRDHVLAIAGGTGVTPFISIMKAVREGSENFRITVLYGVKFRKEMLFDPSVFENEKIKIIPVLSDEYVEGYAHGFIGPDLIKPHVTEDTNIFVCGPEALYEYASEALNELKIDSSRIRSEHSVCRDLPGEPVFYKLKVHMRDTVYDIDSRSTETLLVAMERAGIKAPSKCRSGICGFCHSRVISGEYLLAPDRTDSRRLADIKFGYIHPCCTYPLSDMEIDVPPLILAD